MQNTTAIVMYIYVLFYLEGEPSPEVPSGEQPASIST